MKKKIILIFIMFIIMMEISLSFSRIKDIGTQSIISALNPVSPSLELSRYMYGVLDPVLYPKGYFSNDLKIYKKIESEVMAVIPNEARNLLNTWNRLNDYLQQGGKILDYGGKKNLNIEEKTGIILNGKIEFGNEKAEIGDLLFNDWKKEEIIVKNMIITKSTIYNEGEPVSRLEIEEEVEFEFKDRGYLYVTEKSTTYYTNKYGVSPTSKTERIPHVYENLGKGSKIIIDNTGDIINSEIIYNGKKIYSNEHISIDQNGVITGREFIIDDITFKGYGGYDLGGVTKVKISDGGYLLKSGEANIEGISIIDNDIAGEQEIFISKNFENAKKYKNYIFLDQNKFEISGLKAKGFINLKLFEDNNLVPLDYIATKTSMIDPKNTNFLELNLYGGNLVLEKNRIIPDETSRFTVFDGNSIKKIENGKLFSLRNGETLSSDSLGYQLKDMIIYNNKVCFINMPNICSLIY